MKIVFFVLAFALTTFNAQAAVYNASFTKLEIDPVLEEVIGVQKINSGSVVLDMQNRLVTIHLASYPDCYKFGCKRAPLFAAPITLPFVKIDLDRCQIPHIYAAKKEGAADGLYRQIKVSLNSHSKCMYALGVEPNFRVPTPTKIVYTIKGGFTDLYSVSNFEAEALD